MADSSTPPNTPVDLRKLMADLDAGKLMSEIQNILKQYKLPGVDVEAIAASQKKNIEAITSANRAAAEGLQALAKRQAELLQETMRETSQAAVEMSKSMDPSDVAARQTDLFRSAFERGVTAMREMADIFSNSNRQATDAINARIVATLEEIRDYALKK
jgi:phasin family protein